MRDFAKLAHKEGQSVDEMERPGYWVRYRIAFLSLLLLLLVIVFIITFFVKQQPAITQSPSIATPSKTMTAKPDKAITKTLTDHGESEKSVANNTKKPETMMQTAATASSVSTDDDAKKAENANITAQQTEQPLKFTFYDKLTNKQVNVDVEDENPEYRYSYMLQVGSYRNETDANAMRAKLILAGLTPTVKKVGDWYRVDVGPVETKRQGDVLKHKVESAGISGSLLRQVEKEKIND
ncbi:MAG: SPOR domain-containing protein [Francisellaceae bacterium]